MFSRSEQGEARLIIDFNYSRNAMKVGLQKRRLPNPILEALLHKASIDPRLTDEQRQQAKARLGDLEKFKARMDYPQYA